jgi:hypothetical protein
MSNPRRTLTIGLVLGLVLGGLVGAGAVLAQGQRAPRSTSLAATPTVAQAPAAGAPMAAPGSGVTSPTSGSATANAAIAPYPIYAGSPGLAPDNTIVVTGVGLADVQSDGTNRTAAQSSAISAAIADAKAQATAAASAAGLSISGVLSVSVSVSPNYWIAPMAAKGSGAIACPAMPPTTGGTAPQVVCPPVYPQTHTLTASATVAYRAG